MKTWQRIALLVYFIIFINNKTINHDTKHSKTNLCFEISVLIKNK